jgi:hypothetical protein
VRIAVATLAEVEIAERAQQRRIGTGAVRDELEHLGDRFELRRILRALERDPRRGAIDPLEHRAVEPRLVPGVDVVRLGRERAVLARPVAPHLPAVGSSEDEQRATATALLGEHHRALERVGGAVLGRLGSEQAVVRPRPGGAEHADQRTVLGRQLAVPRLDRCELGLGEPAPEREVVVRRAEHLPIAVDRRQQGDAVANGGQTGVHDARDYSFCKASVRPRNRAQHPAASRVQGS